MQLDNFQDISVRGSDSGAGFQFEFYCAHCEQRWKSPFQPFRLGQFNGLLVRLSEFFQSAQHVSHDVGRVSEWQGHRAHAQAQQAAQQLAQQHYSVCTACQKACCASCFDAGAQSCRRCLNHAGAGTAHHAGGGTASAPGGHGPACPSCSTPNAGGRFCAECGFDMASTHKSCPGCTAMCERATRFCADCGHCF